MDEYMDVRSCGWQTVEWTNRRTRRAHKRWKANESRLKQERFHDLQLRMESKQAKTGEEEVFLLLLHEMGTILYPVLLTVVYDYYWKEPRRCTVAEWWHLLLHHWNARVLFVPLFFSNATKDSLNGFPFTVSCVYFVYNDQPVYDYRYSSPLNPRFCSRPQIVMGKLLNGYYFCWIAYHDTMTGWAERKLYCHPLWDLLLFLTLTEQDMEEFHKTQECYSRPEWNPANRIDCFPIEKKLAALRQLVL